MRRFILIAVVLLISGGLLAYATEAVLVRARQEQQNREFFQKPLPVQMGDITINISARDKVELFDAIMQQAKSIEIEPKSAYLSLIKGRYVVQMDVAGVQVDTASVQAAIDDRIATKSHAPIGIARRVVAPEISAADLRAAQKELEKKLFAPIVFESKTGNFRYQAPKKVYVEKRARVGVGDNAVGNGAQTFSWYVVPDEEEITHYIEKELSGRIDQKGIDVTITSGVGGRAAFSENPKPGWAINIDELRKLITTAINEGTGTVQIPIKETSFLATISPELQEKGVREVIGIGYTTFYGSPANRVKNISVGIAKFNGVIVPQNEVFSFNKVLGPVDGKNGFLKELVIKPEGTVPEYGGGICQVSTTAYRAALYAGLPIVERSAHSYAVTYYSQVGGHGIDATIYPGAHDLRFKNDTPGDMVIQAYSDGYEAYFIFYGTSDGRNVHMDGPYISNRHSEEGVDIVKTTDIPPGTKKQTEKAHVGFNALWYRHITRADGSETAEPIESSYRATKDKILVGVAPEELKKEEKAVTEKGFKD